MSTPRIPTTPAKPHEVFLVHGRDQNAREQVQNVIWRCVTNTKITVLAEEANKGQTILEKFQRHAKSASYAIILMTADDVGGLHDVPSGNLQPRTRQNVLFELGYFAAKIGMKKITILCEKGIEIPSDVTGVGYTEYDRGSSQWRYDLLKEMREAGLDADANRM